MNVRIDNSNEPSETDLVCEPYDFEAILPLELVREHTATDDVTSVSDTLLRLYRRSALESAELYTGKLITGRRTITEIVKTPQPQHSRYHRLHGDLRSDPRVDSRPMIIHNTQYAFATDHAFYYGTGQRFNERVTVKPGTNRVELQIRFAPFGLNCCDPCGPEGEAISRLMYVAGYASECDMPSAIQIGALKYIAHLLENSGDITTVTTTAGRASGAAPSLGAANDPAVASGAVDIWATISDGTP